MQISSKSSITLAAVATALVILSVFSSVPDAHAPPNPITWITKSSIPYATGQAALVGGTDGRIYVAGGFSGGSPVTTARAYDPRTDTWANLTSLPTPTRGPGGASDLNGLIYVISGYSGTGTISNNQVYNRTSNTWSAGTVIPNPVWMPGATNGIDGRIYVIGGEPSGGGTSSALQIYNPATRLWSTGASMATTRKQLVAVSAPNGLIYAIGGYNSVALSSVEAYNITSNTWSSKASLPASVMVSAAALGPDGLIYVFGGSTSYTNNSSPYYNSVYSYDPATNTWYTNTNTLPTARRELGAATSNYNNRMYIMGGANGAYLTTNEEATIGTGHNTITTVACHPATVVANNATSCTATVIDTSSVNATAPTGTVSFASTGVGTFNGSPCTLFPGVGTNSTCLTSITYTPTVVGTGIHVIRGTYSGDSSHNPSVSTGVQSFTLTVTARTTSTVVNCSPTSLTVNQGSICTVNVTDTSTAGTSVTPTGTVSFTRAGTASGSFSSTSCVLTSGSCSVTFTPSSSGTATITGNYAGDGMHATSSGASSTLTSTLRTASIAISCHPTTIVVYNTTSCTVTVTDTSPSPALTPTGTIILSTSGTGTFTTCTLSGSSGIATCTTTYRPTVLGTGSHLLTAHYSGDTGHSATNPDSTTTITVMTRTVATSVSCAAPATIGIPSSCTVTITDTSPGTFITPTGTVTLTTSDTGTSIFTGTCTLSGTSSFSNCSGSVTYTPGGTTGRTDTLTAYYPGDITHSPGSGSFLLTVNSPNQPPVATITSITPNPAKTGDTVTFSGSGQDSDGTIVAYNWRSSISGNLSTTASFAISGLGEGTHMIYFKVEDNNGTWSPEVSTSLTVASSSMNTGSSSQPLNWPTYYWLLLLLVAASVGIVSYGMLRKKGDSSNHSVGASSSAPPPASPPSPPAASSAVSPEPPAVTTAPPPAVSQSPPEGIVPATLPPSPPITPPETHEPIPK